MKKLLCFIGGMLFATFIIPLLDSLLSFLGTKIEYKKIKYNEAINNSNLKLQKQMADTDEVKHAIGFISCDAEGEDENDEF